MNVANLPDEILYAIILVFSVVVGFPLRHLKSTSARKFTTAGLGVLTVLCVCRVDFAYSFVCFIINTLIIKLTHLKRLTLLSFVWCFTYLLFFRLTHLFGLPQPSRLANAVQLIQTLKLVSVASDIGEYRQDLYKKQAGDSSSADDKKHHQRYRRQLQVEPDVVDLFCYSYCYVGLFTGPFFTFRTFYDYSKSNGMRKSPLFTPLLTRLVKLVVFVSMYFYINKYFNVTGVKSPQFNHDYSFLYRMFYVAMVFLVARFRFYSAWLAAECSCISLGFGAYPVECKARTGNGPTTEAIEAQCVGETTFDTVANVDPWTCELSSTVRMKMRSWNKSVQWWLVTYVHRKFPIKSIRDLAVLVVSAYWHGINIGFFGAFCTMLLVSKAEDSLHKVIVNTNFPTSIKSLFNLCCMFMSMRSVDYMYISFAVLEWEHVWRVWNCLNWWVHISAIGLIFVCPLLTVRQKTNETPEEEMMKKQQ